MGANSVTNSALGNVDLSALTNDSSIANLAAKSTKLYEYVQDENSNLDGFEKSAERLDGEDPNAPPVEEVVQKIMQAQQDIAQYQQQIVDLAKEIEQKGLLISEYAPGQTPTKFSFLQRNRLITALSLGTIIIEAGKRSGTLNTAKHAIEQSKELFVVPGNIFSTSCEGSNALIEEFPDTFTISSKHVLDRLKITSYNIDKQEQNKIVGEREKLIVNLLYEKNLDFDSLKEKTSIDSKTLISLLTRMEISGLIKKLPGNFYGL